MFEYKMLFLLCVGICAIVNVGGLKDHASNIQPVGPKMCRFMCLQTSGCDRYVFFPTYLICQVKPQNCSSESTINTGIVFTIEQAGRMRCKAHTRGFMTKSRAYRCVAVFQSKRNLTTEPPLRHISAVAAQSARNNKQQRKCSSVMKRHVQGTPDRLLFFPKMKASYYKPKQLFFSNFTAEKYAYIMVSKVLAVAFISKLKMILVSQLGKGIVAHQLDRKRKRVYHSKHAYSIAVDEEEDLVFVAINRAPVSSIEKMSTRGKKKKVIKKLQSVIRVMAADSSQKVVILSSVSGIGKLPYSGGMIKQLSRKQPNHGLTVDVDGTVYFSLFKSAYKLSRGRVKKISTFKNKPFELIVFSGYVYMTFLQTDIIRIFDVSLAKVVCKYHTAWKKLSHSMCLVK